MNARDRIVVVGKTGYGKSTWTKALVAELHAKGWRVVVFDPCDEYSRHGKPGLEVTPGPLPHRAQVADLLEQPEVLDSPELGLSVVSEGEPRQVAKDFAALAELVRHTGRLAFVVEEVGYFAEHAQGPLKALATLYRKYGVAAVFVAQRATQVPLTARSQASAVVAFRQDEPPDLDALAEKCGEGFSAGVNRLAVGECLIWRDSDGRMA